LYISLVFSSKFKTIAGILNYTNPYKRITKHQIQPKMSNYLTAIAEIREQAITRENALPIRNEKCRSKFWFHPQPTTKVCLFFHGFTAGCYQFEPLAEALYQIGYNLLVPLVPGHGIVGNWNRDNPPPLPETAAVYQQFAQEWLEIAKPLGKNLIVGGYSSGGTLAAWLAQEYAQEIEKTLLFAPYLSGSNKLVDLLVETLPIYYEWINKDNPGNFGYDGFAMPALRVFLDMGQEILDKAKFTPTTPMLIVSSESDQATNLDEHQKLFELVLNHQPESWYYCFDKGFKIPHTMMTKAEGNNYLHLLISLAKAYIESDITWLDIQEISEKIQQGEIFNDAVSSFNINPQLYAVLALIVGYSSK
jgi:pimeloyl-ACP methyl ester carboxylesterase